MPRIRTIKPEFWSSEQVVDCSVTARLLFIGLWNFADDGGVHPYSLKRMKMTIFPADNFTIEYIGELIQELILNGLIDEYSANGKDWIKVSGWCHQKIDRPSYKHPQSGERSSNGSRANVEPIDERTSSERRANVERSMSSSRTFGDRSTDATPRKGREGMYKGRDRENPLPGVRGENETNEKTTRKSPEPISHATTTNLRESPESPEQQMSHSETNEKPAKKTRRRKNLFDPMLIEMPVELDNELFRAAWAEWVTYKRKKRSSISQLACGKLLPKLASHGSESSIAAINKAIESDWSSVHPEKQAGKSGNGFSAQEFYDRTEEWVNAENE